MKDTTITRILLLAMAALVVFSCSKEEAAQTTNQQKDSQTDYEKQVTQTIKDFKEKVALYRESPGYKSGETVGPDSALWLLEATINYSHAFPNEYYDEMLSEELTLTVPKNSNGEVDMEVLAQKYDEMIAGVSGLYYNSSFNDKGLVLVDLSEASQTDTELTLNVETVTGEKGNEPPPNPGIDGPFEEGDDWWYGENGGLCSENSNKDSDAAHELFLEINNEIPDPNGNYYFINELSYDIAGGDNLIKRDGTEDNHLDYYLYFASTGIGPCGDDTLCVEWPEMNIYYSYLKTLIFSYLPQHVPELEGKSIIEVSNVLGYSVFEDPDVNYKHHLYTIYGDKIAYDEGEGPEEL